MATKTRPEFTREAVAFLESSGRPQMQIAAELGIHERTVRKWRLPNARGTVSAGTLNIPSDPATLKALLVRLAGTAAARLESEDLPVGEIASALPKLARALMTIERIPTVDRSSGKKEKTVEEMREEIIAQLEMLKSERG